MKSKKSQELGTEKLLNQCLCWRNNTGAAGGGGGGV